MKKNEDGKGVQAVENPYLRDYGIDENVLCNAVYKCT